MAISNPQNNPPTIGRKRHRIAMVCDFFHPRLGGVENHIWSLSHHLLQLGHSVIVITHAYHTAQHSYSGVHYFETADGQQPLKVYYCPFVPMVDQDCLPTFTATLPLFRWIMLREQIEIVHAHQATSTMANEAIVYANLMGIKSVYTDHSLFGFDDLAGIILNRVLQTTLCTANATIAVSHACRDNLVLRAQLKANRQQISIIPNAIDPSKFTPNPSQRPTASNRIQVVVVSRLVYRKGVDLLVGIIPMICHNLQHVDFLIGGDGSKLLTLQEMVERERLEDRVTFLGAVPHAQVRNVLVQGHVFLNCSLTESFCIAILEAACAGLLVVSTNVGGVPEVLPPDMICLANPTVSDLVQQLQLAIKRQETRPMDPWTVHKRVCSMYSWERVATETVQVYNTITSHDTNDLSTLWSRMSCYYTALDGGIAGAVAALLAMILTAWLQVVLALQPTGSIDVIPDVWVN